MIKSKLFLLCVGFLLFLTAPLLCLARAIPGLTGPVVDQAGVFDTQTLQSLSDSLRAYAQKTGNQLQVLTISSLEGDNLEDFSIRVAEKWKIGNSKTDRGLILLFVQKERRVRIEVGQGLEGEIPDALAGRIIQNIMIPEFKAGNFAQGIILGLQEIARIQGNSLTPVPVTTRRSAPPPVHFPNFILIILILIYIFFRLIFWPIGFFGRGGGWGSSGGWSSGEGGGWSGGGGGFSGGGSSGSW